MKFKLYFLAALLIFLAFNNEVSSRVQGNKQTNELIIASYNIRYDNPNDGENIWDNRKEQVKALIRFHEFDIFGTQEGLINQLNELSNMDEYSYTGVGRDDGKSKGEHSAIFFKKEKFELLENGDFWLSETPLEPSFGWEAKHRRICSWAKFKEKQSDKIFFVFNVHFDHQAVEARKQSGVLMISKIKKIAGDQHVICLGDFNSTPETEQIKTMKSLLNDSYEVSKMPPYGPVGTFNSFNYNAEMINRIDYIFVSKDIDVLKYGVLTDSYDRKYPSDHQPLVAKIKID